MTSIEKELAKNEDWIVVDLNSTQDLLSDLAFRLVDACKNFSDVLKTASMFRCNRRVKSESKRCLQQDPRYKKAPT